MRSAVLDIMPPGVRRSLKRLGGDLSVARRKRKLTAAMVAERVGVSMSTYARVEKGDPTVAMGIYAMALFVLGFGNALGELADPGRDEHGLLLDEQRLPKRVRSKKDPTPL
jgi:transcriptional regulator with XRE-family HTH domain